MGMLLKQLKSLNGKITYSADRAGNVQAIIGVKYHLKLKNWLKTLKLNETQ